MLKKTIIWKLLKFGIMLMEHISASRSSFTHAMFLMVKEKKVCGKNYKVLSGIVIDFSFLKVVNEWSVFFAESSGKIHAPWQVFQLSDFQLWHCATPILHIRKSATSKKYAISSCYVTTFYYWSKIGNWDIVLVFTSLGWGSQTGIQWVFMESFLSKLFNGYINSRGLFQQSSVKSIWRNSTYKFPELLIEFQPGGSLGP